MVCVVGVGSFGGGRCGVVDLVGWYVVVDCFGVGVFVWVLWFVV